MAELANQYIVHAMRKDFDYTVVSGTQYKIDDLPKGAVVLRTTIGIKTAFNAASTNVLIVGTAGDDDALVAAAGVDETAVAVTSVAPATLAGNVAPNADTALYVKYTQSGTAASAGAAWVVVEYVLDPAKYL